MRRLTTTLALALLVLGCSRPQGEPVQLLTYDSTGCYLGGEQAVEGELVTDPQYGTRFNGWAIVWPAGFTGVRLANGEVAVLDQAGNVVATTGNEYGIARRPPVPDGGYPAAIGCPYPQDFYEVNQVNPVVLFSAQVLGSAALVYGLVVVGRSRRRPATSN